MNIEYHDEEVVLIAFKVDVLSTAVNEFEDDDCLSNTLSKPLVFALPMLPLSRALQRYLLDGEDAVYYLNG